MKNRTIVTFNLEVKKLKELKVLAEKLDLDVSKIIRKAIDELLLKNNPN